jgi:hypothetical protein
MATSRSSSVTPVYDSPADGYGSSTVAFGTEITRIATPKDGYRTQVNGFSYLAAGTAHTLTLMVTAAVKTVAATALTGQAVIALDSLPVSLDGGTVAADDWFVLEHADGTFGAYKVSSVSSPRVTMTANLSKVVKSGSRAYFMGAPADHADRQFACAASTRLTFQGVPLATTTDVEHAILAHSNNATATGVLEFLTYGHVKLLEDDE